MANVLKVHKISIDLDTVSEMSDEDYARTLSYVSQWDHAEWTNALHKARTGEEVTSPQEQEPEPEAEASDSLENMTVEELKVELALRDLPVSGHKAELIERLRDAGGLEE